MGSSPHSAEATVPVLEIEGRKYDLTDVKLGEGGFGKVMLGKSRQTGEDVAVKILENDHVPVYATVYPKFASSRSTLKLAVLILEVAKRPQFGTGPTENRAAIGVGWPPKHSTCETFRVKTLHPE